MMVVDEPPIPTRAEMAAMWRKLRRDDPRIARLYWRARRAVIDAAVNSIFYSEPTTGGLSEF